jgi:hypothetical protein
LEGLRMESEMPIYVDKSAAAIPVEQCLPDTFAFEGRANTPGPDDDIVADQRPGSGDDVGYVIDWLAGRSLPAVQNGDPFVDPSDPSAGLFPTDTIFPTETIRPMESLHDLLV